MDSSISRAWTPYSIFLSDRNDPLWECWYNLSNLTNQWVYKELAYRNWSFKEMITGSAAPSLPSFLPFYFRPRTFSIKRAQLSRNLEQATASLQPAFVAHRRSGWTRSWIGLLLTVTDVSTTCGEVIFRVNDSCIRQLMVLNSAHWPDWSLKSRCCCCLSDN